MRGMFRAILFNGSALLAALVAGYGLWYLTAVVSCSLG